MSLREIVALLFRHLALVLSVLLLPVLAAGVLFTRAPKSYEADAKVLVSGREASVSATLQNAEAGSEPQSTAEEALNSEIELLTGRQLADRTLAAVGARRLFPRLKVDPKTGEPDPDAAERAFTRALKVKAVPSSHVVDLGLVGPSAAVATEALAKYLDIYQQLHHQTFSRPVAALLQTQLQGYEAALRDVDGRIAAFSEAHHLFDPEQERRNLLDTRSSLFNTALQLRTHSDELASRVRSLQGLQTSTPQQVQVFAQNDESEAMARARGQLLDLQQQSTKLRANYQPTSRVLRDLDAQIRSVQAFLDSEGRRFSSSRHPERNPLYDELVAETARAEAQVDPELSRAAAIDAQVRNVDQRLSDIAKAEQTLDPLQRERSNDVATVAAYRQRLADATVTEDLDRQKITNVAVIQPAAASLHPTAPKLLTYLLGGLAAGLVAAAGLLGLIFASKNTFLAPESVEARTRIPVLVSLPRQAA